MTVLSLWAGSSMQEQLVKPPTVKSLQPSFQVYLSRRNPNTCGKRLKAGWTVLATHLLVFRSQGSPNSPASVHHMSMLQTASAKSSAAENLFKLKLKTTWSHSTLKWMTILTQVVTILITPIPLFALIVRLANSSLLHCPQQRRQKLCLMPVQKMHSHNHYPLKYEAALLK